MMLYSVTPLLELRKVILDMKNNLYFYRTIVTVFQILIAYRINTKHMITIYKK